MDLWRLAWQCVGGNNTAAPSIGGSFTAAVAALSPTAHWPLNEPSGTDAADVIGAREGTYLNTPTLGVAGWASDGTGVTFDGASDEGVSIADHADLDLGTSDATFLFAVKMASWRTAEYSAFITKGAGVEYFIGTHTTTNRVLVYIVDTGYELDLSTNIADGAWHLLMISLDRSGLVSVFVDGASTAEDTADISAKVATDITGAADVYIARSASASTYELYGSLQHVAYWKGTALTGSQFATLYAARSGSGSGGATQAATYAAAVMALAPDAYYKMDEGSGTTMFDASATDNDGTYHASPTMGVAGPFAGATGITFDGSTQYASAPYTSALDAATGDFSILAWVKTSGTWVNWNWLVARPGEGYDTMELFTGATLDDELAAIFSNAAESSNVWASSSTTTNINDGAWHMVGLSADRDGLCTFWLDGAAYGTADISAYVHTLTGSHPLYLARRSIASFGWWAGTMCQVAIWAGYLLTSGDVADLWTAAGGV